MANTRLNIQIFHYIDNHYDPRTMTGTLKKGSAPLKRERDSFKCNVLAFPEPKLPINFYSTDVGEDRIKTLDPKPELHLPKVCYAAFLVRILYSNLFRSLRKWTLMLKSI